MIIRSSNYLDKMKVTNIIKRYSDQKTEKQEGKRQ